MSRKKFFNMLCEAGLYGRFVVQKPLLRKQTLSKGSSRYRYAKTGQLSSGIKSFGLRNQTSKYFSIIGVSMCDEELVKKATIPVSN